MKRIIGSVLGITLAATGLVLGSISPAFASNAAKHGCTSIFLEYETHGNNKHLKWVESRNICGGYFGHFQTAGVDDADRNPIATHRVQLNIVVPKGSIGACSTGWEKRGGGYVDRGHPCVIAA